MKVFRSTLLMVFLATAAPALLFGTLAIYLHRDAVAGAAALALALALAIALSRAITRPVRAFNEVAMRIAQGTFGVQVKLNAKNELDDLAQTFNYMSQQLLAYDSETRGLYASLEEGYLETIVALANAIDSKDSYTRGHSQRVADLSVEIGKELKISTRELRLLHYGGLLHDIGKIGIMESILRKQTRLTEEEMAVMREHPTIGSSMIKPISFLASVQAAVRNHHERWDGTGYPDGLKGEEIPLIARIVNAADTYDACTSTRPYQPAFGYEQTLSILEGLRGGQLDPKVLDAMVRVIERREAERRSSPALATALKQSARA